MEGMRPVYTTYESPAQITMGRTLVKTPANSNFSLKTNPAVALAIRADLATGLDIPLQQWILPQQTHSQNMVEVDEKSWGRGAVTVDTAIPNTDALYSFAPDTLLAIQTADCVPVLFYETQSGLIGAIHSGWRGTVQNITGQTFQHIKATHPEVDFSQIKVHLGPSLCQECFEVDQDVQAAFAKLPEAADLIAYDEKRQKWLIDNQGVVAKQCLAVGIQAAHISQDHTCTLADPTAYSYRENKTAGRLGHFIFQRRK